MLRRVLKDGRRNLRRTPSGAAADAAARRLRGSSMCGIAGLWERRGRTAPDALAAIAGAMTDTLVHRGPRCRRRLGRSGSRRGARAPAALDHRPVAGRALSRWSRPAAATSSPSTARSTTSDELRAELEAAGRRFRGHSRHRGHRRGEPRSGASRRRCQPPDRHVRVRAVGPPRAGALRWCATGSARSRSTGPSSSGALLFGSELKALRADPELGAARSTATRSLPFLRYGYVPAPRLDLRGVHKLPPGTILHARPGRRAGRSTPYWSLRDGRRAGLAAPALRHRATRPSTRSTRCCATRCRRRMVADVPLGAFLSGGIDSSTVVALMQAQSTRPVRTFTIGFHERRVQRGRARRAPWRGTSAPTTPSSTSTPRHALDVIPQLPTMYDEPFADSSQIPTYLVSQAGAAARHGGAVGRRRRRAVRRLHPLLPRRAVCGGRSRPMPRPLRSARRPRHLARCRRTVWTGARRRRSPSRARPAQSATRCTSSPAFSPATGVERLLSPARQPLGRSGRARQRRARTAGAARRRADTLRLCPICRADEVSRR